MDRTKNFKLGQIHGKLRARKRKSEAHIQRTVFLIRKIKIWRKRNKTTTVRMFGYEVPLQSGKSRGSCVDLMGYDKDRNLYLIELKKKGSGEKIPKIIKQINDYENMVKRILPCIEREFKEEFLFPIKFNKTIRKIILAPREFYSSRKEDLKGESIDFCYFRDKNINKRKSHRMINLSLAKK